VTFAAFTETNGQRYPEEPFLHNLEDRCSGQALDYLLLVSKGDTKLKVMIDETKVEKFEVLGHKFMHLSDHYGISTIIN
jgi:hypothetical protein